MVSHAFDTSTSIIDFLLTFLLSVDLEPNVATSLDDGLDTSNGCDSGTVHTRW